MIRGNLTAETTVMVMGGSWAMGFVLALCLASCGGSQERLTMDVRLLYIILDACFALWRVFKRNKSEEELEKKEVPEQGEDNGSD